MRTLLLMAAAVALLTACDRQSPGQSQAKPGAAEARPGGPGLDRSQAGKSMPALALRDPDGEDGNLSTIAAGKPLLVNLWATWCAPCVKELPTLVALAARPGAPQVIALSQDTSAQAEVAAFLAEKKFDLEPWQDKDMAIGAALGEIGRAHV